MDGDPACDHRQAKHRSRYDWPISASAAVGTHARAKLGTDAPRWKAECPCGARRVDQQIGLEAVPDCWHHTCGECHVCVLRDVFREVKRVLRNDGLLFINYGDCYREKQLMGMGWRLVFALQEDGWLLRSEIKIIKQDPVPQSATDRPSCCHESVFMFAKQARYYWDQEACREQTGNELSWQEDGRRTANGATWESGALVSGAPANKKDGGRSHPNGRNMRNVLRLVKECVPGGHTATFPQALVQPLILSATAESGVCASCGSPWRRIVEKLGGTIGKGWHDHQENLVRGQRSGTSAALARTYRREQRGWLPSCQCGSDSARIPATVLDCFLGTGTTLVVARKLGRRGIGIELSEKYAQAARKRISATSLALPMGEAWGAAEPQAQPEPMQTTLFDE